ncbi:hypothetical protein HOE04_05250 [archaeon]|jgi:hypothetical protein|nr:hypothetical protein [archaeon]
MTKIKSLEEISKNCRTPKAYNRYFEIERKLIDEGVAESLPQFILYEHQVNGRTMASLARQLGIDKGTFRGLIKKLQIPSKSAADTIADQAAQRRPDRTELENLYKTNTLKQIGEHYDVSKSTVHNWFQIEEIEARDNPLHFLTKEERSANARIGYEAGIGKLTTEERAKITSATIAKHGSPLAKLTSEEKRNNAIKAYNASRISSYTPEQRREICRKGLNQRSKEEMRETWRKNIGDASEEEKQKWHAKAGLESSKARRNTRYYVESRFYVDSQQEGAVALILEKYLTKIYGKTKEEVNFQVKDRGINNGGLDFLINDEFLEWHPILLYSNSSKMGSIPKEEFDSYKRIKGSLDDEEKKEFQEDYKRVLGMNYRNTRQKAVDDSGYSGCRVIHAENICELYDFIERFGGDLPSRDDLKREFRQKVKYVKGCKVERKVA